MSTKQKPVKLYEVLQVLTPREWMRYCRFVHTDLYTLHTGVKQYMEILEAHYPEFEREKLSDKEIHTKIFGAAPYRNVQVRTLRKYLLELLMDFLAIETLRSDKVEFAISRLRSVNRPGMQKVFQGELRKVEALIDHRKQRDSASFWGIWQKEEVKIERAIYTEKRSPHIELSILPQTLDQYYLINLLRIACSAITQKELFGQKFKPSGLMVVAIDYCQAHISELPIGIALYFRLFGLLALEDHEAHFQELKSLLHQHPQILSDTELGNVYNLAINYCNRQYRLGESSFLHKMLDLYKEMLNRDLLFDGEILSVNHFKNITTLGLRIGELDWTEHFIHTYAHKLPEKYQEANYSYNLAHLLFYRGDHGKALRLIQQSEFIDPFYRISAQMIQLKIYLLRRDLDAFLSLLDSFQTFLRRRDWPERRKLPYLNFAKLIRMIYFSDIGLEEREACIRKIQNTKQLVDKEWLLSMVTELG